MTIPASTARLPIDVTEALAHLRSGGVAEIFALADEIHPLGTKKLEIEPAAMMALCILAAENLPRSGIAPVSVADGDAEAIIRSTAPKLFALSITQQRRVIVDLRLDADGDHRLKDYEWGIVAIRRAVAAGRIEDLLGAIERANSETQGMAS